jgi:hypothetical protein
MKSEHSNVTGYALDELPAAAREEFEKELAQSDDLQCELRETTLLCQTLGACSVGDGLTRKRAGLGSAW